MVPTSEVPIPWSPKQALAIPEWKKAMMEEYQALIKNDTWCMVPKSKIDNIINTRWIFRVKHTR